MNEKVYAANRFPFETGYIHIIVPGPQPARLTLALEYETKALNVTNRRHVNRTINVCYFFNQKLHDFLPSPFDSENKWSLAALRVQNESERRSSGFKRCFTNRMGT